MLKHCFCKNHLEKFFFQNLLIDYINLSTLSWNCEQCCDFNMESYLIIEYDYALLYFEMFIY